MWSQNSNKEWSIDSLSPFTEDKIKKIKKRTSSIHSLVSSIALKQINNRLNKKEIEILKESFKY